MFFFFFFKIAAAREKGGGRLFGLEFVNGELNNLRLRCDGDMLQRILEKKAKRERKGHIKGCADLIGDCLLSLL